MKSFIKDFKVIKGVYHRNGISGLGFWAIDFTWIEDGEQRHAIGTVASDDVEKGLPEGLSYNPATRIIMLNKANEPCIEETMRGDNFHEPLVEWIQAYLKTEWWKNV